ncbi:hypothetical protein MAPG_04443 [Magnaporthiopsis poae ATCC 64411]|uniref:DUF2828 domain-containing protein n=1 Tax=Magnaporthiopsis poae (strain ATCC 64411 / 73-15) TaxID=644358 RepID=A0A0C4DWR3_MAGP6|nr:hypothetical protein MAPG_04443 [Magnaporthiopsis poae ATCC 64411]
MLSAVLRRSSTPLSLAIARQSRMTAAPWFLSSNFPVLFPTHRALTLPDDEFESFIVRDVGSRHAGPADVASESPADVAMSDGTLIDTPPSTTADVREVLAAATLAAPKSDATAAQSSNPFMGALLSHGEASEAGPKSLDNKMFTENNDVAHRSSKNALVDLFFELEDTISSPRLIEVLTAAWAEDPEMTLKIVFNARSIHLGKSSKTLFYRCAGWLAQNHPLTLAVNLRWLSRPVIPKKAEKEEADAEKPVLIDAAEANEHDPAHYDARHGVAHGYWKDLLNILALAANGTLNPLTDPKELLNLDQRGKPEISKVSQEDAKVKRQATREDRHKNTVLKFENDAVYRALHMAVSRLFASQLKEDLRKLRSGDAKEMRQISLCAKWAPSMARFHDKHTFVVSTLAELLSPPTAGEQAEEDRETFLRHARDGYRRDVAALRKQLEVVERDVTAQTFDKIKYDRVPSIAMQNYTPLFVAKDTERFDAYVTKVAQGKARISGAVLLPSTLVSKARSPGFHPDSRGKKGGRNRASAAVEAKIVEMEAKVLDGQWATLVQRIRDSGTLSSSLAVCDVSGSMDHPRRADGTTPMDSAIGLSLLVAEVAAPPFAGAFITFSEDPRVERVNLTDTFKDKIDSLEDSDWGMSTNFVAVFEKLILPIAVESKIKPEDMVKRVFVFSDMQFNEAESDQDRWSTSFERISKLYEAAGYEMPELVFWNLAGGRAGVTGFGDPTAPKPVTADTEGTALVSGYSQGMLKVFLDGGGFEDPELEEEEEPVVVTKDEGAVETLEQPNKKRKRDPLDVVKRAVNHKAYSMLRVVD